MVLLCLYNKTYFKCRKCLTYIYPIARAFALLFCQIIQIGARQQILILDVERATQLFGHARALFNRLFRSKTNFELQVVAEPLDLIQVDARLTVQKEVTNLAHFALDAEAGAEHAIQNFWFSHLDQIELR